MLSLLHFTLKYDFFLNLKFNFVCVCVIVDTVIVPTVILCVGAGATSGNLIALSLGE